jgi:hypothetical protein
MHFGKIGVDLRFIFVEARYLSENLGFKCIYEDAYTSKKPIPLSGLRM